MSLEVLAKEPLIVAAAKQVELHSWCLLHGHARRDRSQTHLWILKLPGRNFRRWLRCARARVGRRCRPRVVAAYRIVQGVAAVSRSRCIHGIRRAQTRVGILAPILRKVFAKEVWQPLVKASTRLGPRAADGGCARHRRPPVVLQREAHAVLPGAGTGTHKCGRQLREVFVGVVVKSAPGAIHCGRGAVAASRPWRNLRSCARSSGRISRYRRHSSARGFQYSQLLPVVGEARLRGVPIGGPARSMCGGVLWRRGGRDGAR